MSKLRRSLVPSRSRDSIRSKPAIDVLRADAKTGTKAKRVQLPTLDRAIDGLPAQATARRNFVWREER